MDAGKRVHRIIGVARDVTEERAAIDALRASEERFRQLAETIREVFWMFDATTGAVLYVSPGYELVWGRSCDSLRQTPSSWLSAVHPDDRARVEALAPMYPERPTDITYRILRPDGSERWIRDRSFPIRTERGDTYRRVGVADDITELVRTEERDLSRFQRESGSARCSAYIMARCASRIGSSADSSEASRSSKAARVVSSIAHCAGGSGANSAMTVAL